MNSVIISGNVIITGTVISIIDRCSVSFCRYGAESLAAQAKNLRVNA